MIVCPNCAHENPENVDFCEVCGTSLAVEKERKQRQDEAGVTIHLGTQVLDDGFPKWGSARFNKTMDLVINVEDTSDQIRITGKTLDEVVLGRKHSEADTHRLDVDLTQYNALKSGVSREHARIVEKDGALHIIDNGSSNGTYLNGQKLVQHQPRILRNGDDLRLGKLRLNMLYTRGDMV